MKSYSEYEFIDDVSEILDQVEHDTIEIIREEGDPVMIISRNVYDMFIHELAHMIR